MTMSAWKINALPGRITAWFLSWFLFASGITLYIYTAHKRHIENPDDKVVPTIAQLTDGFLNASLKPAEEDDGTGAGINAGLWQRVRHSMLWHGTIREPAPAVSLSAWRSCFRRPCWACTSASSLILARSSSASSCSSTRSSLFRCFPFSSLLSASTSCRKSC
jgi:hypothetical protein